MTTALAFVAGATLVGAVCWWGLRWLWKWIVASIFHRM